MTYQKDIGNLVYYAAVVSGLSLVFNMATKKLIKIKPADLGTPDFEDSIKLVASVSLAMWTQDYLEKRHIQTQYIQLMASIAIMLGGAVPNALAFSGSYYLFFKLG